jgi:anti-anti-sigma regulatory factor
MSGFVSIQWVGAPTVDSAGDHVLFSMLHDMLPLDGDFVIIRAEPRLARQIEHNLRLNLVPYGVEPVSDGGG